MSEIAESAFGALTPDSEDRRQTPGNPPNRPGRWRRWIAESAATLSAVLLVCTFVGSVIGVMGFKLWGPQQEVAQLRVEVRQRDSTVTVRVIKLEDGAGQTNERVRDMQASQKFMSYLLCVQLRRSDPDALPPDCTQIIRARGAP